MGVVDFDLYRVKFSRSDLARKLTIPKPSSDLAEETGLHLGDGSMNVYRNAYLYQLRGNIQTDRKHYDLFIKSLYMSIYNIQPNLREMPSDSVYGFQVGSKALVTFKSNVLKLPLGFKRNFEIPEFVMLNHDYMRSFIRGVFDTDSTLYLLKKRSSLYPRVELTTISQSFALQLNGILKLLDFLSTLGSFNGIGNRHRTFRVSCRGVKMLINGCQKFQRIIQNFCLNTTDFLSIKMGPT